jgi:hypothetical protein
MGENKVSNLFSVALETNELSAFILGRDKYFILDKETNEHFPVASFQNYIEPYLLENSMDFFDETFWSKISITIEEVDDLNMFLDSLVGLLIPYYNAKNFAITTKRKNLTPAFFIEKLSNTIIENQENLRKDKRGIGADWNIVNKEWGMLGGLLHNLDLILQRGGPNFIPVEFAFLNTYTLEYFNRAII